MQVRAGRPSGGAGQGDDVPSIHGLPHRHQQLGVMGVERRETAAVVDHDVVAVAGTVLGDGHRPWQCGADRCPSRNSQIHPAVALGLAGKGISPVAELRGDDVPPVLAHWGTEAVRADERHV